MALSRALLAVAALLAAVACVTAQPTCLQNLRSQPQYSYILDAVQELGLDKSLNSANGFPYTAFMPTNAAFDALSRTSGIKPQAVLKNRSLLKTLVQYHIVNGKLLTGKGLEAGRTLQTLNPGGKLQIAGGGKTVVATGSQANIVSANNQCSGGVWHGVDNVLLPIKLSGRK